MSKAFKNIPAYSDVVHDARTRFVIWVNGVLTKHIGCSIDEFRLVYYLNNIHQVNIDWWVVWALSKHVRRLVLDFTPPCDAQGTDDEGKYYYVLDQKMIVKSWISNTIQLNLTSLCLKCVNVDTRTFGYLLNGCCSTLEKLCIVKSRYLASIVTGLPSLKWLMISGCPKLRRIDIRAPKLGSLSYNSGWNPSLRVFNVENACKLSYANVHVNNEEQFLFVLRSLFKYFSHLEHLSLNWLANLDKNLVLVNFPVLPNLKHLEMFPKETGRRTLVAWVPFIGACPRLEKLTLGIYGWLFPVSPKNVYQEKCPLSCLKTFEIRNFHGNNLDVDIANFVVWNGVNLQEVIIHHTHNPMVRLNMEAPFAAVDFKLPPHVKVVIVK